MAKRKLDDLVHQQFGFMPPRNSDEKFERLMPQLSAALVPLQQQCRHVSAAPVIVEGAP